MGNLLGVFIALFVFTMTAGGINSVLGPPAAPRYDIVAAAHLLDSTYLTAFEVPTAVSGPLSYLMLTVPAVMSFFIIRQLFPHR